MARSRPARLTTVAARRAATASVAAADPALAAMIDRVGPLELRPPTGTHFAALVRAIMYQQLAGAAAAALHGRMVAVLDGSVTPEAVLAADPAALRAAGLSAGKLASVLDLALRAGDGSVPLEGIEKFDDDEIVNRLTLVRGIGRWTAEMFLLFELRRADIWPVGDLAVRHGWGLIHGLEAMPTAKELEPQGDRFRPFRTAAAWYCWQAVHLARGAPEGPTRTSERSTSPRQRRSSSR